MCRKTLFISMVVLAAASVSLAENQGLCEQYSCFCGGGITYAARCGCLGFDADTNFSTGQDSDTLVCGPCNGTHLYESSDYFIDQGAATGGCGGIGLAGDGVLGGGIQGQCSGYIPSRCGPTCYPYGVQGQAVGAISGEGVLVTCGNNGATAGQAGAASQYQNIQTPANGGSEYQHIAGHQSGMAVGSPTSLAAAGGITVGGGIQCQSFGGLPPL
jgi:hypothetical protein